MSFWSKPGAFQLAEEYWYSDPKHQTTALIDSLARCDCYWVNDDLTELVFHAAELFPPEPLARSDFPEPDGLVLFTKPFLFSDYGVEGERADLAKWPVSLITWGPGVRNSTTPFLQLLAYHFENGRWSPYIHDQWEPGETYENAAISASEDDLKHRRLITVDRRSGTPQMELSPEMPGGVELWQREARQMRRVLQTFWRVSQQQIVVQQTEHHRRVGRFQQQQPVPPTTLRIVRLRSVSSAPRVGDAQSVDWSHRWIVSGHWRNQWLPSVQMHRNQWIAPYVKGPEDKPLVVKETVKALVR